MFLKSTVLGLLCLAMTATSTLQAQDFRALGTRRGALIGAVAGGLIGGHNDEVAAGIIAGGLVGGVTGRVIGNQMNARNYGYGGGYHAYQPQQTYYQPQPQVYVQPSYGYAQPRQIQYHRPAVQQYVPQQSYGYNGGGQFGHSVLQRGSYRGW